jgi:hypothetical protein
MGSSAGSPDGPPAVLSLGTGSGERPGSVGGPDVGVADGPRAAPPPHPAKTKARITAVVMVRRTSCAVAAGSGRAARRRGVRTLERTARVYPLDRRGAARESGGSRGPPPSAHRRLASSPPVDPARHQGAPGTSIMT